MEINKEYNTAIADASIAVKNPVKIPPMMITIKAKLGIASFNTFPTCFPCPFGTVGYLFFFATTNATSMIPNDHKAPTK